MNTKYMSQIIAALAFCFGTAGAFDTAHAQGFSVHLDCHGNGGDPDWAKTGNTITVKAEFNHSGRFETLRSPRSAPASLCDGEDEVMFSLAGWDAFQVTKIRISINGTDTFWMDQMILKDTFSGYRVFWEADNNVGYCFSTDGSDGNNSYCLGDHAWSAITFATGH